MFVIEPKKCIIEKYMTKVKITVNSNSALKLEGDFEIVDKQGNVYDLGGREVVSLCRCGLSNNKPFCDGAHKGLFEDTAIAFNLPAKKVWFYWNIFLL